MLGSQGIVVKCTAAIFFPTVDCNAKLSRFNSRFYQLGAEAVDAFTLNWDCENNWIFPPVSPISRVIAHSRACKAVGTLVVPMWKSSHFWALLCDDGKHWNAFVHDCICPHFHTFLCKFFSFLNACISVKTSLINTKLGDFVNLGVLFLTMWINSY